MDRQTLRDWVHRYNADDVTGLSNRPHAGGPQPQLCAEYQEQVSIEHVCVLVAAAKESLDRIAAVYVIEDKAWLAPAAVHPVPTVAGDDGLLLGVPA